MGSVKLSKMIQKPVQSQMKAVYLYLPFSGTGVELSALRSSRVLNAVALTIGA